MIWDKPTLIRAFLPSGEAASVYGARWKSAAEREPALAADLIRLGRLLATQPTDTPPVPAEDYQGAVLAPIDPMRLAYEAGKRDLALQLLSLMQLTHTELANLMESNHV